MKTEQNKTKVLLRILVLAALWAFSMFAVAGSLDPSGPPAPTMKTLEQIEPRIIANTLAPDVDAKLHISQPGNYYLIADVISVDNNKHGIKISADNVTLDLNGFVVASNLEVTSLDGISIDENLTGITISDGTIRNFQGNGVNAGGLTSQCRLERLNIFGNSGNGIQVGTGSIVLDCAIFNNQGIGAVVDDTLVHRCNLINNVGGPMLVGFGTSSEYDNNY